MNEKLIKKLQALDSEMRQKGTSSVKLVLTDDELAAIVAALAVQDLDEDLRRAGLSD